MSPYDRPKEAQVVVGGRPGPVELGGGRFSPCNALTPPLRVRRGSVPTPGQPLPGRGSGQGGRGGGHGRVQRGEGL